MRVLIVIYLMSILSFTACMDTPEPQSEHLTFLIDRTEKDNNPPSGDYLLQRLPNRNPNDAITLCYATVGDTRYVGSSCFALEKGQTGWLANEDTRRRQLRQLEQRFTDSLSVANSKVYDFTKSDIFRTVLLEIQKLSKQDGSRELWLFSDMMEHSFFSVYNPKHQYWLHHQPEKVVALFEAEIDSHADFSGIRMRIVHSPNLNDEPLFTKMVAVYRQVLEPKGVQIQIGLQEQITIK